MSNCYDHEIKKNMLSTVYGSKEDIKEDLMKSRLELVGWFSDQLKMYDRAMGDFDQWYEEYVGDTWEENNKDEQTAWSTKY